MSTTRVARETQQALRLKTVLENVVRALHPIASGWYTRGDDTKAQALAEASKAALVELNVMFENPRRQDSAKHFMTRIKNFVKMLTAYAKASSWADLEPVLKAQSTKSKSAYDKFREYADEVHDLVSHFDTEHEDTIHVGGWTVALFTSRNGDWNDKNVEKLKYILAQTTRILTSVGAGAAAKGGVSAYPTKRLPGAASSAGAIASYHISTDRMWLSADDDPGKVIHSLVHESGHRVYFRLLSGSARSEWAKFFEAESGPPDVDTLIKAWEQYTTQDKYEAKKYGRYFGYFAGELRKTDPDTLMWLNMIFDRLPLSEDFDRITGTPKKGSKPGLDTLIENKDKIRVFLHPVTAYSGHSAEELFAETFAAYAIEGPGRVPEILREMFRRVFPQAKTAAAKRIVSRFIETVTHEGDFLPLLV